MRDPRPRHVLVIDGAEEVGELMREVLECHPSLAVLVSGGDPGAAS